MRQPAILRLTNSALLTPADSAKASQASLSLIVKSISNLTVRCLILLLDWVTG